ncbi:DNA polymerase III subunit gamma/tau [Zhaonella formicivorans]|uniref:DNA polymerase III subunit gamma/tau n=1 Tax=Zhaonella formicivorans TaxID=2528593 RepID=UPI001D11DF97|nr:DNA polymerase III subunit gamma/tau [Zhaonella formicivorans]
MGYIALYRQWRPLNFKQVVGQEHVVRTLKNALIANRTSHAYLFCGPRGTGKTSMAKILAKAVNCLHNIEGEPCNECVSCRRINAGHALDILEIDAASNRGIDEIRDLREKIKLSPVEGRFKVYIIDEVHMLTTEAFNALLKTLEEPPAHVVFILATTEPHKIPLTILSRCQRFDFHRIPVKKIVERLKEIVSRNNIEAEEGALFLIAKIALGGMRDALSLLDQCMASGVDKITVEQVTNIAGIVSDDYMLGLVDAIRANDATGCLTMLYEALAEGKEVRQFIADLILHLRNLVLLQLGQGSEELITVPDEVLSKLREQSKAFDREKLLAMIKILVAAENDLKWSSQGQILLEMALLKIMDILPQQGGIEQQGISDRVKVPPKQQLKQASPVKQRPSEAGGGPDTCLTVDLIKQKWTEILDGVRKNKITSYAFFVEAEPLELQGNELVLQYKAEHKFHKERSEQPDNKKVIEHVLESILGAKIHIRCILKTERAAGGQEMNKLNQDELIQKAIEIFGGEVVEVE